MDASAGISLATLPPVPAIVLRCPSWKFMSDEVGFDAHTQNGKGLESTLKRNEGMRCFIEDFSDVRNDSKVFF